MVILKTRTQPHAAIANAGGTDARKIVSYVETCEQRARRPPPSWLAVAGRTRGNETLILPYASWQYKWLPPIVGASERPSPCGPFATELLFSRWHGSHAS